MAHRQFKPRINTFYVPVGSSAICSERARGQQLLIRIRMYQNLSLKISLVYSVVYERWTLPSSCLAILYIVLSFIYAVFQWNSIPKLIADTP